MVWPPYWQAARIAALALANWSAFDGACALRGVDPLRLPADRLCNAFLVWLEERTPATEEGQMRWRQVVEYVNAPPARPPAARSRAEADASPVVVSHPERLPAGAPVPVDAEAAAFAAFEGMA